MSVYNVFFNILESKFVWLNWIYSNNNISLSFLGFGHDWGEWTSWWSACGRTSDCDVLWSSASTHEHWDRPVGTRSSGTSGMFHPTQQDPVILPRGAYSILFYSIAFYSALFFLYIVVFHGCRFIFHFINGFVFYSIDFFVFYYIVLFSSSFSVLFCLGLLF